MQTILASFTLHCKYRYLHSQIAVKAETERGTSGHNTYMCRSLEPRRNASFPTALMGLYESALERRNTLGKFAGYIYIYIYIYIYRERERVYIYIYIYIYTQRERVYIYIYRERERERERELKKCEDGQLLT